MEIEAEERAAAGRRLRPEAVTEQKAGYQTADAFWTKVTHPSPGMESANAVHCDHRLEASIEGATAVRATLAPQRTRGPLPPRS